ncbi:MAG: hypothetical protein ACJ8KF_01115 [Chthoniobacterales bacterium]
MSVAETFDDNFPTLQAARFCPFCSPYSKDKMIWTGTITAKRYDDAANVIETHEHAGELKEP